VSVMRLLDLYCKQGGAGVGYSRAGFEVVGVDIEPQPRYPFEFHQADALSYLREHWSEYDAIHASPPCQGNTALRFKTGKTYRDWIIPTRDLLLETGKPFVIENVPGAKLIDPLMLCGTMFGLKVIRHRIFENNFSLVFPPASCQCTGNLVGRRGHLGKREYMTITGHFSGVKKAGAAMGIDWMNQDGLAQAIPPAYTEYVGSQMRMALA
jgi:DNA (cytosine-5)-methyltransferase 1